MYSIYRSKEDNKYHEMMGVYPEYYHQTKAEDIKKIYDHRAKALMHYYYSKKEFATVQILTKHHKNCALYMEQLKSRERE